MITSASRNQPLCGHIYNSEKAGLMRFQTKLLKHPNPIIRFRRPE
jgi:hypothetical protein